jgi:hypothetical protein
MLEPEMAFTDALGASLMSLVRHMVRLLVHCAMHLGYLSLQDFSAGFF